MEKFHKDHLEAALRERQAVKAPLMRSTLHIVTADDFLSFRPGLQVVLERTLRGFFKDEAGRLLMDVLADAARAFTLETPGTFPEIRTHLSDIFPGEDPVSLSFAARAHLPLVQVPPAGMWRNSGTPTYVSGETWLGRQLAGEPESERRLVLSHLRAFGPASEPDITAWAGRSLKNAVNNLKPDLVELQGAGGRILLDLPRMPLPDADTPAPVRFLPRWDNVLLSHRDRSRVLPEQYRSRVILSGGRVQPTILVDGFVAGLWDWEQSRSKALLTIKPFERLSKSHRDELDQEGMSLLRFLADDEVKDMDVQVG
ncbi:MAG: winged helix DNA-binding domain-containing protein [Dehalococcoidia bacterium]